MAYTGVCCSRLPVSLSIFLSFVDINQIEITKVEKFVKMFERCDIFLTKLLTKYYLKDIMYLYLRMRSYGA